MVFGGYFMNLVFQLKYINGPCDHEMKENFTMSSKYTQEWQIRVRELQGGLIFASTMQILVGLSGIFSIAVQFIGPLTLAPAIITSAFKYFAYFADR